MRLCLALFAGAVAVAAQATASAPKPYFTLHQAAPGVFAATANPGTRTGSNAGFVIGDNGVAIVDTFEDAGAARALLAAIHDKTSLPVRYVINTHYHLDHVAGNQIFADAGATILAQHNVPGWIHTQNLKFFGAHPTDAQRAMVAAYRAPDVTYTGGADIYLGSRHLEIKTFTGHTGGDSAVRVDGAGVVFTGDLFWDHSLPNLIDASTAQLITELAQLETWPAQPDATFVPGHGPLGHAADVTAFRQYLITLRQDVADARARGLTGDALVAAVTAQLQPTYGDWSAFAHFGPLNLRQTEAELAGTKVRPPH